MNCKTSDHLNIYFEVLGNSNAKQTIVFLNGLSQSTISWALTTPYFTANYKIILIDFIFQGQSDKTGDWRSFDQHAKDVLTVLNFLKEEQVIVCGLSYGSLVAQHMAVNFPKQISKLILVSTFARKTPYYEAIELSWWRALDFGGYSLMLDIMLPSVLSENYFTNPLIPIDLLKQTRQGLNDDKQALFKLMRATKEREDYRKKLALIDVPAIVIQGDKDLLFPVHMAKEVSDSIPHCQLSVIPNAGHTLNLEAVPQLSSLILEFLKS
ncbi:MAG: alpha/beta fold hydrolase [Bacteroidota bacterium]